MPSPPPPSAIALLYYAFTVVLISSALAVHSTSSFLFGPLPSLSTQSLVSSATTGLTCRGNGAKLEHLTGECMSQFECVQQSGLSLGPCSMHHALGSCCLLKSTTVQSKQSWRDQTNPPTQTKSSAMTATLTTLPQFFTTLPVQLSGSILSKTKQSTMMSDTDSTFYEVITANNRKTTTGRPKTLLPVTEQFSSEATSTTAARPNSTKSDKLVDLNSSPALWPQYDPSTNGWFQPAPISSSGNPSIPNIHVEDIFSNHFPGLPGSISLQPSSTASSAVNHFPTLGPPPVLPSVPSTTASPQDIAHTGRYTCGVRPLRPTGRVVGGRNAAFGEWPWQVLIKESGWLGLFMKPKCGGVLIDDRWILTAAHCQPGVMGSLIVMLGQNDMNGDHQQFKPVVKMVRRMIVHRDYNPETFDNDIALLELETPFEMKPHVVPICLPEQDYHLVGEFAHIAGFGKLNYGFLSRITGGQMPSTLQTVKLPIIANAQCQKMFADAGHFKFIRDSFLCAGYPQGGKDSCEGDSGGPLMIEKNGVWTLVGTVSHGIKCAEPNMPGVYMKTFAYLDWIRGITGRK